jgi:hypothetical protein
VSSRYERWQKPKRQAWRKAGLCATCGQSREKERYLKCLYCRRQASGYSKRWREKRRSADANINIAQCPEQTV